MRGLAIVTCGWLLACAGKASQDDSGPAPTGTPSGYCDALVAFNNACGKSTPANCDTCIENLYRPDALGALTSCTRSLSCSQSSNDCLAQLSAQATGAGFTQFKSQCEARLAACQGTFGADQQFFCFEDELGVASDQALTDMEACFAQPCTSIRGCMDVVPQRYQCR